MKTPYISSFFYFLIATALMPISSLNVNAQEGPGDKGSMENQKVDKPEPKKEKDCKKQDSGKSRMSLSSSFASISGGFSTLAPDQATPSFVGLHASNVGAPVETKTRSASPVLNFPGGISAFYATPQSLTPFGKGSEVLRSEEGWVRQVRSATGFLNVEETPNGYVITGYNVADIPAVKNAEGFYNIPTGLTPLSKRTVTVLNGGNKIKIEESTWYGKVPRTETVLMEQTSGKTNGTALLTQTWSNHNGVYKVAKTELTLPSSTQKARSAVPAMPVESYTNVIEEMGTDGVMYVVEKTAGTRTTYRWDDGPVPLSECNAVDESGNPLPESTTTTYTYYTDSTDRSSYGRPATMRKTDGYWENYEYSDNNMGGIRTVKTLSPWMNTPAPALGEQPTGAHRVKQEVILETDTGTSGLTVTVNGIPIEKYWIDSVNSGENTIIDTKHQPHSGGDKITVTKRYCRDKTKVNEALMGKPLLIKNADGSLEVYTYQIEGNTLITTCDSGYGTESSVSKGIRTISKTDKTTKKLKEEIRYALQDGSAYWLSSKTGVDFDPVGNCLKWIYNNNPEDYSEQRRDCCQINWERGRDGIETTYTRDASGKLISETSRGKIKTYERKGLTTIIWRQEVGSTQSYLMSEETRDMARNIISNKISTVGGNLLTTSYSHNIQERVTTKTTPFGTTEQESMYVDRQLASAKTTTDLISVYEYTPLENNGGGLITTRTENGIVQISEEDLLGKNIRKTAGNGAVTLNVYNPAGLPTKTVLPDGETLLNIYEQDIIINGVDLDGDNELNISEDRIIKQMTVFDHSWPENKGSWRTTQFMAWQGNWKETNISWQTEDKTLLRSYTPGLRGYSIQEQPPLSQKGNSYVITTMMADGERYEISYILSNGNVDSSMITRKSSDGEMVTSLQNTQSIWGDILTSTEARIGTVVYLNDDFTGIPLKSTTPDGLTTEYQYDNFGRIIAIILPDGSKQNMDYDQEGRVIRQWGSQQYPVSYEYDAYGRKTGMITYRSIVGNQADFPNSEVGDKTTWIYESSTGNILQKKYADGKGLTYTYTLGGKLKTLTNARENITTHSYDCGAKLISSVVNDNFTPRQDYVYDQLGRQISATTEGLVSYQYAYNDQNQVVLEDIALYGENDVLSRQITRSYDQYGRRTGYQLKRGDKVEQSLVYQYNKGSLLSGIVADGKEFHYNYVVNAPHLIEKMTSPVHVAMNSYEPQRDQLIKKNNYWKNKADNRSISGYAYVVNPLGQRISVTTSGEVYNATQADWQWQYDVLGQVIAANQNVYVYDQIGNRKTSRIGEATETTYTANALNQYATINTSVPTYDEDGNQLTGLSALPSLPNRNLFVFFYDANNRPIRVEQNNEIKENYAYDHQGRRVKKGGTFTLYDGYNAIAQYQNATLQSTFSWGIDMGGNLRQQAGGVGGLISVTDYKPQLPVVSYPTYDGNGNITEYLTGENQGTIAVHYEYDSFGIVIRKTGSKEYCYQFSTKPFDNNTGLNYYNYRDYDPMSGRWINRDPIGESGGVNIYCFANNNSISFFDYLGTSCPFYGGQSHGGGIAKRCDFPPPDPKDGPTFLGDHCNMERGGDIKKDYTDWLETRLQNSMKLGSTEISKSVEKRVAKLCFNKGDSPDISGIKYGIKSDKIEKNGDKKYSMYERYLQIGNFSLYPKNITITWKQEDCSYTWTGLVYAEEKTGRTPISDRGSNFLDLLSYACPMALSPRKMNMGEFNISGEGSCPKNQ